MLRLITGISMINDNIDNGDKYDNRTAGIGDGCVD